MPATSFVYEFFLYNSVYQYDWETTLQEGKLIPWSEDLSQTQQQSRLEKFLRSRCKDSHELLPHAFYPLAEIEDLEGDWTQVTPDARKEKRGRVSTFDIRRA